MHYAARVGSVLFLTVFGMITGKEAVAAQLSDVPVSAPIDTNSAGRGGDIAAHSVMRILCIDHGTMGTGFLHKSGKIVTADHVIHDCEHLQLVLPDGTRPTAKTLAEDQGHDLALIEPSSPIKAAALSIASDDNFKVGIEVSTWGFPGGYFGLSPLLSVGYLSGIDAAVAPDGSVVRQWVVNAAFNGGNSGGPLIQIETGAVFGVVSSKVAPITQQAADILRALENEHSGFTYTAKTTDGKTITYTEGQLVGMVLAELRQQMQLVIGKAVMLDDIKAFLSANKIEP